MATASTNLEVVISAKDEASAKLKQIQQSTGSLGGALKTFAGVAAAAFSVGAIVEFGKKSVEAALDAEKATRQLNYAVMQISKGTKEQATAINDLSDALQRKSGIDGDALKIGAAQLSTFGLSSKAVLGLTKSLADLTVNQKGVNATSDDFTQSANVMAKALKGQFGVLEKSGIRFTEAQQKLIQYGTETEKVAALQEGLNQNLKETTDTVGASTEGALARMSRAWGEIQESVGGILIPLLASVAEKLVPIFDGMQSIVEALKTLGQSGNVLTDFLDRLDSKTGIITFLKERFQEVSDVFQYTLLPAFQKLWEALQPAMPFFQLLGQILGGALVVAISALAVALEALFILFGALVEQFAEVFNAYTKFMAPIWKAIVDGVTMAIKAVESLINALNKLNVIQGAKDLGSKISNAISGKKATGGPVLGGSSYLVGERGPEIFTPGASGAITPNGGGGGQNINIQISGAILTKEAARMMGDMILGQLKLKARI